MHASATTATVREISSRTVGPATIVTRTTGYGRYTVTAYDSTTSTEVPALGARRTTQAGADLFADMLAIRLVNGATLPELVADRTERTTQPAPKHLTEPGHSHTATFGRVSVSAQLAVGGGVTLTVWDGPNRHDAITFSYKDAVLARRRYAEIAQLAVTGSTPADIDRLIHGRGNAAIAAADRILTEALAAIAADPSPAAGTLTAAIADARHGLETDAQRAEADRLAANVNAHLDDVHGVCRADEDDLPPARSLAEFRDRHAAAVARDLGRVAS